MGLEHGSCVAVRVRKLMDLKKKNILILFKKKKMLCVPKMNEGLSGLEKH